MTRKRTGEPMKQPDERGRCSRDAMMERISRAVAEGLSLHAAATRERMTLDTLKSWLAEDDAFRARYEKARAIGRSFVLDDVLALADSLPGAGRADIRLKLAARKWWAAEVARDAAAQKKSVAERRYEAELRAEAKAEAERERRAADEQRRKMEREVEFLKKLKHPKEVIVQELERRWPGAPLPPSVGSVVKPPAEPRSTGGSC